MKKLGIILMVLTFVMFIAVPAMAATLTEGMTDVFQGLILGVIQLLGVVVLGLVTMGLKKLLKKWKLEEYEATVLGGAEDAIMYAEEWARKEALERGYAVDGAEKFDKAYQRVSAKLPFLESDQVKEALVVNLAKLRDYGLEKGRESLEKKLAELNGNGDENTDPSE